MTGRQWALLGCALTATAVAIALGTMAEGTALADDPKAVATAAKADPALARAREQVKMLDDLYKTAVVSITQTYVDSQDIEPAIVVAKQLFAAMEKQGWPSTRLVDATGEPINEENAPKSDFEKEAYQAMRAGKPYLDRVIGEGPDRRLLAATVVPVVLKKCAECHNRKKVGEVLGFLRYDLPIK